MPDEVGKVGLGIELDQGGIGKQISAISKGIGSVFAKTFRSSMRSAMKGAQASAKSMPAPKIDTSAAKAEVEHLTAVLDNVNARLHIQRRKLAELNESYKNTFGEAQKNKIQEDILKTEAAILRLSKQSDNTSQKIWKLEDNIESAGKAIEKVEPPTTQVEKKLQKTNKTLGASGKQFKAAAKGAGVAGAAFAAAGKRATSMGNQFTAAFKRIAKQVLIFTVIYKAIRSFQNFMGSALNTNDEFSKSLNAVRTNLRVAFQPIFEAVLPAINALMSALARITAYIAAFMSAIFGTTYKQAYESAKALDANRKAMDGYGKSAKKAAGQLAGFDELNVLHQPDEAGAGGGGAGAEGFQMEMPDLDVDHIQSKMDALALGIRTTFDRTFRAMQTGWQWTVETFGPGIQQAWAIVQPELEAWKTYFGTFFNDVISLGEPLKNWWDESVIPLWENSIEGMAQIFEGISEITRTAMESMWEATFPIIEKFINEGLPRLTDFLIGAQNILLDLFNLFKNIFTDIWEDAVDPVMQIVSQIVQDTLDLIFEWWDEWGKKINENTRESLDGIKDLWKSLWTKHLKPIVTTMLNTLKKLWDDHLKHLIKEIGNFIGTLISAAQDILNEFILPVTNWLVQKLGPIFSEVFDGVMRVIGAALGGIIDATRDIIKALGGIVDFIAGVFTGDWKRAWNGIKDFMSGIGDAIVGVFKGAVNAIIEAFNWMIRQLNKVSIDIPDWVPGMGGKTFGISIPEIPKLAKGGLVQGPTLAMVGDNPGANVDPEVVSPLSKLQEMLGGSNQEVVEVLYMILAALQDYSRRPVLLEANGTQLAKIVDGARDDRNRRAGRTLGMA